MRAPPCPKRVAASAVATLTIPPTERSMPPSRITIVCPVATSNSVSVAAVSMFNWSRERTPDWSVA